MAGYRQQGTLRIIITLSRATMHGRRRWPGMGIGNIGVADGIQDATAPIPGHSLAQAQAMPSVAGTAAAWIDGAPVAALAAKL